MYVSDHQMSVYTAPANASVPALEMILPGHRRGHHEADDEPDNTMVVVVVVLALALAASLGGLVYLMCKAKAPQGDVYAQFPDAHGALLQ